MKGIIQEILEMNPINFCYRVGYELGRASGLTSRKFSSRNLKTEVIMGEYATRKVINESSSCILAEDFTNLCISEEAVAKLKLKSDNIYENKLTIFDLYDYYWGSPINWNLDPASGLTWPVNTHWSKININDQNYGDIKYNWELNRHQHFITLGRAYTLSGDEKYAETFVRHIESWIEQNPHEMTSNWYSNLEIALRVISWVFAWDFFKDSKHFNEVLKEKYLVTLYLMAEHIYKNLNLSKYCISNDHIIGDCVGLLAFSICFPQFTNTEKWRDKAIKELWKQLDRQVFDDGSYFAYSINYHRFVTQFYILTIKLLRENGIDIPSKVLVKVEKMLEFMNELILPDGSVPSLGEIDGGVAYKFDDLPFTDYRAVITTGYKLLGVDKPVNFSLDFNEEGLWLLGDGSTLEKGVSNKSAAFNGAGYYILKDDTFQIVYHCGKNVSGYGQADMLSVDISCNGDNILADCGTYLYNGPKEWRDYFKGTGSHNTVCVDRQDQMINHRRFKWLKPTDARLNKWIDCKEYSFVDGTHFGYNRLSDAVTHSRAVFLNKGKYIVVADYLHGEKEHDIGVTYNIASRDYEILDKNLIKITGPNSNLIIQSCYYEDFQLKAQFGEKNPIGGWISREYGTKEPCLRALYTAEKMQLPVCFGNVIFSNSNNDGYQVEEIQEQVKVNGENSRHCFKIKLTSGKHTDYFIHVFDAPADCRISIDGIGCFEGSTIVVAIDEHKSIIGKIAL